MSKTQPDKNIKDKLYELREQLNNLLIDDNLQSEKFWKSAGSWIF
jgi:hypothetical protein